MHLVSRSVAVVVLSSAAPATADPTDCIIRGEHVSLEAVRVRIDASTTMTVSIFNLPVVATSAPGSPIDLAIGGVIGFHGTAQRIWYSVTQKTVVADGMVTLGKGSRLVGDYQQAGEVIGDAVVYSDDVMQGEDKSPSEAITAVHVRCDRLSLDWESSEELPYPRGDGTTWHAIAGATKLVLHSEPVSSAPSITYSSRTCGGECFHVTSLAHRRGWRQVSAMNEGVSVTGWLPDADLQPIPEGVLVGYSYGCSGHHHTDNMFFGGQPPRTARIRVGAQIFAAPGSNPWATVLKDSTFEVRIDTQRGWALVTRIPGLFRSGLTAYVPASALILAP